MWLSFSPCVCVCVRFFIVPPFLCLGYLSCAHLRLCWFICVHRPLDDLYYGYNNKKKERRKQTERKRVEAPQGIYSFLTAFHILIVRAAHIIFIRECPQFIYLFIFFFRASPWHTHTGLFTIERIIYISFSSSRFNFWLFVVSLVPCMRFGPKCNNKTQYCFDYSLTANFGFMFHFFPLSLRCCAYRSPLSFSSDRYNVGDLLCSQMTRGTKRAHFA